MPRARVARTSSTAEARCPSCRLWPEAPDLWVWSPRAMRSRALAPLAWALTVQAPSRAPASSSWRLEAAATTTTGSGGRTWTRTTFCDSWSSSREAYDGRHPERVQPAGIGAGSDLGCTLRLKGSRRLPRGRRGRRLGREASERVPQNPPRARFRAGLDRDVHTRSTTRDVPHRWAQQLRLLHESSDRCRPQASPASHVAPLLRRDPRATRHRTGPVESLPLDRARACRR